MAGEYKALSNHLVGAYYQASKGKGKERHARDGQRFEDQPICRIGRTLGTYDYEIGQAIKKIEEAKTLHRIKGPAHAKAELYGAMNYLAAACILIDEGMDAEEKKEWA